jgi:PKD repeat protein
MGKRTVNWWPFPANWSAVTAAGGWTSQGPASYIPTQDDDQNTRLCYTWLGLDNYKPSAAILSMNCLHSANSDPASIFKNPTLAPGETWGRWRVVVVYGAPHPSFSQPVGDWSMRIQNWTTVLSEFSPSYNSVAIYWGVWGSQWINGGVPDLFNMGVAPNRMFDEGAQSNFDKWSAVWGISKIYIEQEINTPDPVYPPTASFTTSQTPVTLTINANASGSTAGSGTISSYAWNWGDGATSTGVTASHTYAAGGTYTITLTVTNSAGLSKVATKTQVVASIPGTGGMPEVPDPDPTPPPPITPPNLPETDLGVAWYPVAKTWATQYSGWIIASPAEAPATASTPPLTLIDRNILTGVRAKSGGTRSMTLYMPMTDGDVQRDPLPSGMEFKRAKLLIVSRNDKESQDARTWTAVLKSGTTTLATVDKAVSGAWESDWASLASYKTDAAADAFTVELTDTSNDSLIIEARVHVEYGLPGVTLPAPPIRSDDYINPLPGSIHLRVVPAAAGLPSPSSTLDKDTSGSMPPAGLGPSDPISNNIENGVSLPFGFGIGGYGLDVGCIDGSGVEWWLTDVEGWDDGLNAELTTIDPELGTGTFVNNVAPRGREVVVSGVLYSHNASALLSAKRKLVGCLSEPPHIGWMVARDTMLPVALAGPIKADHVSPTRVDFEATFRGVRAPYSLGMGVWREGKYFEYSVATNGAYVDYPQTGSTPMTPIINAVGPINAGSRIDAVSLGATYRSGGFLLQKAVPAGATLTINNILRRVTLTGTDTSASDYINWSGSRWMYLDARGCRVLTTGGGSGSWRLVSRELW